MDAAGPAAERDAPVMHGQRIDWTPRDAGFGVLWFLFLFLLLPLVVTVPFYAGFGENSNEYFFAAFAMSAVGQVGIAVVAAYFTFQRHGGGWERLGIRQPEWSTLFWAGAALVAAVAFGIGYQSLVEWLDIEALMSECDDQIPDVVLERNELLIAATIIALAFAPVCEEIFFRGFVFPGLARWGVAVAVAVSAALFSGAHIGPNLHRTFIPIFGVGIIFALAYLRSGNLLSVMAAHFAFNILGVVSLWNCDP